MNDFVDEFDVGPSAPKDRLERLASLVKQAAALQAMAANLEADAKAARKSLYALVGHPQHSGTAAIPDLMAELQLEKISVAGFDLTLNDEVTGSLPKDPAKREAAIRWLEEHDGAGLIQTHVGVDFGRSQYEEARGLYESLKSQGDPVEMTSDVHHSTLKAYARQRLKEGEEINLEGLGLYLGKTVKLKEAK